MKNFLYWKIYKKSGVNSPTDTINRLQVVEHLFKFWFEKRGDLFVCLFIRSSSSHSRIFQSYGDVTTTGERLQILTYARHSCPLRSECSLACHTYCDTGHPFIMVISEDPRHSHLLPSVWQWRCPYLFLRLRSVEAGIRTPNIPLAVPML